MANPPNSSPFVPQIAHVSDKLKGLPHELPGPRTFSNARPPTCKTQVPEHCDLTHSDDDTPARPVSIGKSQSKYSCDFLFHVKALRDHKWLNDEVVNAYIKVSDQCVYCL
jgi:hypothetical protein